MASGPIVSEPLHHGMHTVLRCRCLTGCCGCRKRPERDHNVPVLLLWQRCTAKENGSTADSETAKEAFMMAAAVTKRLIGQSLQHAADSPP